MVDPVQQTRKDLVAVAIAAPLVSLFAIGLFALVGFFHHMSMGPGIIAGFPLIRTGIAATQGQKYRGFLPRALILSILGVTVASPATASHSLLVQFPFLTLGLAIAAMGVLPLVRADQPSGSPVV